MIRFCIKETKFKTFISEGIYKKRFCLHEVTIYIDIIFPYKNRRAFMRKLWVFIIIAFSVFIFTIHSQHLGLYS